MPFLAWKLINNDPIPSGCDHRNEELTVTEIDGGRVTTCNFCQEALIVTEDGSLPVTDDDPPV